MSTQMSSPPPPSPFPPLFLSPLSFVLPAPRSSHALTPHCSPPPPFLLFDRAAGFLPPRPRIVAGRRAQMAVKAGPSSAATPSGAPAFTAIEHDGRLDRSGRLHSC